MTFLDESRALLEKRTLILAVGLSNVKVRQSTCLCVQIGLPGAVRIEEDSSHRVDIPAQSFKLGSRPSVRLRADERPQFFKLIHQNSIEGGEHERKVGGWVRGARDLGEPECSRCARRPLFLPACLSHTIGCMEPIQFLTETIIAWVREIAINLSSRFAEDFIGKRVMRRRRSKRRRKPLSGRNR